VGSGKEAAFENSSERYSISQGPVRKTEITLGISSMRNLTEELVSQMMKEVRSLSGDDRAH